MIDELEQIHATLPAASRELVRRLERLPRTNGTMTPKEITALPVIAAPAIVIPPEAKGPPPEAPKVGDAHIAPKTTAEEDRITFGQRAINEKWETTQQIIAVMTSVVVLGVTSYMIIRGDKTEGPFLLLSNMLVLVLTFYFQRTNHQRVGGVQKGDIGR